ncbi:hypothetical protein SZN_22721 [Streptomyces zinciresistens K42]|uniref:DUF3068 domain-containing protein n=1 Tax=Streptomyces zinciresistens K42 TaxID=700597 RepID=G2GGB0_9ACTN|nr:DUF3068 domain-containing protein [Streptomyces zinciresistens]EGX57442.1 hypothetical protein SZN_22721 [Streptomyces zinciresistens K42]
MRRTASPLSLILLGLGTFLLVLAPMLAWYVTPRAAVNPIDIDTTAVYRGTGSVFDTDEIKTVPDRRITVTQRVRGDVAASERSGNAVWDVVTTVDTDTSLPAADPYDALDFTPHRWVMDRRTTRPVHCCGESPYIEGEAYLKFPFDVAKRSYQWWDNTGRTTVTLRYEGTERVQGYPGYRFTARVAPRKVGTRLVPGSIVGTPGRPQVLAEEWYSNHGLKLVVDQRTGRVIYAQTGPRRTLRAPGGAKDAAVLLDSRKIAFTAATQRDAVRQAKRDSGKLRAVGVTLPVAAAGAGSVLAVVGGVLVVRGRKRPENPPTVEMPRPSLTM